MNPSSLLTLVALAASANAAFTSCATWGETCTNSVRPNTCIGLAPLCYSPSAGLVCAACKCIDGPLKGSLQGGSVEMGIADSVCQQFFSTNSTQGLNGVTGPVLVTTTKAAANATQTTSDAFTASNAIIGLGVFGSVVAMFL